jgi:hypothetical protein
MLFSLADLGWGSDRRSSSGSVRSASQRAQPGPLVSPGHALAVPLVLEVADRMRLDESLARMADADVLALYAITESTLDLTQRSAMGYGDLERGKAHLGDHLIARGLRARRAGRRTDPKVTALERLKSLTSAHWRNHVAVSHLLVDEAERAVETGATPKAAADRVAASARSDPARYGRLKGGKPAGSESWDAIRDVLFQFLTLTKRGGSDDAAGNQR